MRLNTNYFLLYHGLHAQQDHPIFIDEKIDNETFFEIAALMLCVNKKSFQKITRLPTFHTLLAVLTSKPIERIETLYHLQYSIIEHFMTARSTNDVKHLHQSFSYLLNHSILDQQSHDKLVSLFDPSLFESTAHEVKTTLLENFHTHKQALTVSINAVKELTDDAVALNAITDYLNTQRFSIGITGVMNAGKSTLLNALMGQEILGTSVVPETANLTIVSYCKTPFAKVVYWNTKQWSNIEQSAKDLPAMQDFVQQTHTYYPDNLHHYIQETAVKEQVDITQLDNYTSAKSPDKRCNLVSHVELGSNLRFLHDGIEIVDTPGLDDVVIQREEITKEYISRCDLMIHLMNVSQSATQKDIDFIIDAVLYQNISKVLIVITRADLVNAKELKEVIDYTKQSIASQLHEQNAGSKLDFILQNLHFIAFSGQMALLHKTGKAKEALDQGFTLEQSGITHIEEYLQETLFGKHSQRGELIIRSAKKRLSHVVNTYLEKFYFELSLLSKSEDELDTYLHDIQIRKESMMHRFNNLKAQLKGYEDEAKNYIESLSHFLQHALVNLQATIKKRLLDETTFSLEKEKTPPKKRRITLIVDTAIKHGVVDILRDYRYKFITKSTQIRDAIELQFTDMDIHFNEIDTQAFDHGFLTQSHTQLHQSLGSILKNATLSKLPAIDEYLNETLKTEFSSIEESIKHKATKVSTRLLAEFFTTLKEPINHLQTKFENDEIAIQEHLLLIRKDNATKSAKQSTLLSTIKALEQIVKEGTL